MFEILPSDKDKIIVPYRLHRISHDSPHTLPVFDEIQFEFLVLMHRISELALMAFDYVETVLFGQRSYLIEYAAQGSENWILGAI